MVGCSMTATVTWAEGGVAANGGRLGHSFYQAGPLRFFPLYLLITLRLYLKCGDQLLVSFYISCRSGHFIFTFFLTLAISLALSDSGDSPKW